MVQSRTTGPNAVPSTIYVEPHIGLLREVMDAHGGFAAWDGATRIRAIMSTGGLLFPMRTTRTAFHQTEVVADLHAPHTELHDFPRQGQTSFFAPDRVRIEDKGGNTIAQRENPRAAFHKLRKQLHWDQLDAVYFAGYAVWNYLTAPFLLCRSDIRIEETTPCLDKGQEWRGLTATFPAGIPTHNQTQTFYFDERAHLRRHDYHAEVIAPYAVASHYCNAHQTFGSAVFPTRRKVVPRTSTGKTLPFPTLVWIRVHEAALEV